jgi:hypothetical protein
LPGLVLRIRSSLFLLLLSGILGLAACEPVVLADDDDTAAGLSVEGLELQTDEDVELAFELPLPEGALSSLLNYEVIAGPSHGEVSTQGAIGTYSPSEDWSGEDSFRFRVSEGGSAAEADVIITVTSVPDAPRTVTDEVTLDEDTSVSIYVLANDSDPEGDDFEVIAVGTPADGLAEIEPGGTVRYTPDPDFNGSDAFTYVVEDTTGMSSSGDVEVSITPVADGPVATDDDIVIAEDIETLIPVLNNDTHPDGLLVSLDSVGLADYGATALDGEEVRYTPAAEFQGEDSFTYVISDSLGLTASATVTVMVTSSPDAPYAGPDTIAVDEDTPLVFDPLANDNDPEGGMIFLDSVSSPSHGYTTMSASAGTITYTPEANYFGADSFTYEVSDEGGLTSTGQVTVTVASINDAPVGNDLTISASVGSNTTISVDATDVEGDTLAFLLTTTPALGNVGPVLPTGGSSAQFVYTPTSAGVDIIGMTVTDPAGGLGSLTVTITNGGAPLTLSGSHSFDTDTGWLDGSPVNDWDGITWSVGDFVILPGATLSVVGSGGLQLFVAGDAEVFGDIDVSGEDGGTVSQCDNVPSGAGGAPGSGGYAGGSGAPTPAGSYYHGAQGLGGGGGGGGQLSSNMATGGAGGGHQIAGGPGLRSDGLILVTGGSPYTSLPPLQGGSGGGGGSVEPDSSIADNDSGAGGGGGGGAVSIIATGDITVGASGGIDASGGEGGWSSCTSGGGSGGGGAGGAIELLGGTMPVTTGTLDVSGGLGNATNGPGGDGGDGYLVVGTTN